MLHLILMISLSLLLSLQLLFSKSPCSFNWCNCSSLMRGLEDKYIKDYNDTVLSQCCDGIHKTIHYYNNSPCVHKQKLGGGL